MAGADGHPRQFHVDNLSSAHVYLRLPEGDSWDAIPKALLEDCAQLTKANSIEGMFLRFPCCKPVDGKGKLIRRRAREQEG